MELQLADDIDLHPAISVTAGCQLNKFVDQAKGPSTLRVSPPFTPPRRTPSSNHILKLVIPDPPRPAPPFNLSQPGPKSHRHGRTHGPPTATLF